MDTINGRPIPHDQTYRNLGIIIGIVIFILLGLFIIAIIVGYELSSHEPKPPPITLLPGGLLSDCSNTDCSDNLICDGTNFTCRYGTGAICNDANDCVTGLICSGLCATGDVGKLNQLCPCDDGYFCTPLDSGLNVCKGLGGTHCDKNSDCVSSICKSDNTCATGAPDSFPCDINKTCASNNCNNGFCQPQGIITGTQGAACTDGCFGIGVTGAVCDNTPGSTPLTCVCLNGSNNPGTCVIANQGILSICDALSNCANDLICLDSEANNCTGGSSGNCVCVFPYDNPNVQAENGICISGMTSGVNQCVNDIGMGCDTSGVCSSNICNGRSVVNRYQFVKRSGDPSGTVFSSAIETNLMVAFSGPTGLISPYKMFATSTDTTDTLYLVDHLQGLLSARYNVIGNTGTEWDILIPYNQNGLTLIDATYNNGTFLVAYQNAQGQDVLYWGNDINNLQSFNGGVQFTVDNVPLNIDYVDLSDENDVLISINGSIYVKTSSETNYSLGTIVGGPMNGRTMSGLTGPARFYYDPGQNLGASGPTVCPATDNTQPIKCPSYDNISFVGPLNGTGNTGNVNVLQYSGNIATVAQPIDVFNNQVQYEVFDYSIYSPSPTGMQQSNISMLVNAFDSSGNFIGTLVAVANNGMTVILPFRVSTTVRTVTTQHNYYFLSLASCSN